MQAGTIDAMITKTRGNILQADTEAIVNTVNTVGVMGKGIALQFKETYPQNYLLYREAAERNEIAIGKVFLTETGRLANPRYIINFPTKVHWKEKSKYEYIESGLDDLVETVRQKEIRSIAIPPLGCGNGGLDRKKVKNMMVEKLSGLNELEIVLYEPSSEIAYTESEKQSVSLTEARAMVLELIKHYTILGYEVTILEIQKLAYFLQRFGEPLNLKYKSDAYGPYAHNLTHLLRYLDGSFIVSKKKIADAKPFDKIKLKDDRFSEVTSYIEKKCSDQQRKRLTRVSELIQGFESPFGLELLATVDWVIDRELNGQLDLQRVVRAVHDWSDRKKVLMKREYVKSAIDRLSDFDADLYPDSSVENEQLFVN
jgi:O-acetyl-ADP-ribose deacetylase (regulator of RNase III)